jgi:predicted permease
MAFVLSTVLPVFCVVAVGYGLGGRRATDVRTLSDLALLVTSPALLFSVLAGTELDAGRALVLVSGTLWIAGGTALIAVAYRSVRRVGRGLLLPSVFFNAGNMGLACSRLAFGPEGLEAAAIVFVTIALLTSLFGIWIAKGENGLSEALRMPLLYGSAGGLALAATRVELPRLVMEPIEMLGAMAIPLMLLTLGIQLRRLQVRNVRHALVAVGVRMGGGFALGLGFVTLLGVDGVDRQVLLLDSAMPAAVINVVISQRYGADPELVASAVVLSTLASVAVIPAVLGFVTG